MILLEKRRLQFVPKALVFTILALSLFGSDQEARADSSVSGVQVSWTTNQSDSAGYLYFSSSVDESYKVDWGYWGPDGCDNWEISPWTGNRYCTKVHQTWFHGSEGGHRHAVASRLFVDGRLAREDAGGNLWIRAADYLPGTHSLTYQAYLDANSYRSGSWVTNYESRTFGTFALNEVTVTGTISGLNVSWKKILSTLPVTYSVDVVGVSAGCTSVDGSGCHIDGLEDGKQYSLSIHARTSDSGLKADLSTYGTAGLPPDPPTGLVVVAGDESARVSWVAPDFFGSPSTTPNYRVTSEPDGLTCETASLNCSITGLRNGQTYTFSVVAFNAYLGNSAPSPTSDAVMPSGLPFAPKTLAASVSSGTSVALTWQSGGDNGSTITQYLAQYRPVSSSDWQTSDALSADSLSATIRQLVQGTSYLFRVVAVNANGPSVPSTAVQARAAVPPDAPSAPIATQVDANRVRVSWTPAFDGGAPLSSVMVRKSSNNGRSWDPTVEFPASDPAVIGNLLYNVPYLFQVSVSNERGASLWSISTGKLILPTPPDAINELKVLARTGASATVAWQVPRLNGSTLTGYELRCSQDGTSWNSCGVVGNGDTQFMLTGLSMGVTYQVQVRSVISETIAPWSTSIFVTPGTVPGAPAPPVMTSKALGQLTIAWSVPSDAGGLVRTGWVLEAQDETGALLTVPIKDPTKTFRTFSQLPPNLKYEFRIAAVNELGQGAFSANSEWLQAIVRPVSPTITGCDSTSCRSRTAVTISVQSQEIPVGSFSVQYRNSEDADWSDAPAAKVGVQVRTDSLATDVTLSGLATASAYQVRVSASNAEGSSDWSNIQTFFTLGARPMRLSVVDGDGLPVIGGAITWRMSNGSAWSSRTYGLTDDGVIDLPMVPAGSLDVTIKRSMTAGNLVVSGTTTIYIGWKDNVVQLPAFPLSSRTIRVIMPNGMPVPNVRVTVPKSSWVSSGEVGDFSFKTPIGFAGSGGYNAQTNAQGEVTFWGAWEDASWESPVASLLYDDGVITQTAEVTMNDAKSTAELDYMPWISVQNAIVTADSGKAVPVTVFLANSNVNALRAGISRTRPNKSGVKVTVMPPKGTPKGTCRARMSGVTDRYGRVTLTVCATKSGVYGFKTSGAASVSTFKLFVKGTAPMPVTSVTARSLQVGSMRATWGAPLFDGKSPVVSYTVTATAKGKKTITRTVHANVKNVTLDGLANATTYTVTITATTKKGTSDPVTVFVPVA